MASISIAELTNGTVVNNIWEGTGIFDTLIEAVNKNIEIQYNLGRIKGTDYANAYIQGLQTTIQYSADFLLRQRELEVKLDIFIEEAKLARTNTSLSIAKTLAEVRKQYGFAATLNVDDTITIGADLQNGILDKELELKTKQIELSAADILLKTEQIDIMGLEMTLKSVQTEAEIEKQYGYDVTTDVNGNLVLGATTGNGILDKELELKAKQVEISTKEIELKTSQIGVMGLEASIKAAQGEAEIEKQYGYIVTRDIDGNLELGASSGNGALDRDIELKIKQAIQLDEEKETADKQQLILTQELAIKTYENLTLQVDTHNINLKQKDKLEEDIKVTTTQKVKLDKETALLGLDDVIKLSIEARDGTYVYTPKYTV